MTQKQENSKELKLSIPTPGKGPGDVPLVVGAHDTPSAIKGAVSFECNYDCKGSNIIIQYTALAKVRWSIRKFPSVNLVREQVVWVLNSALPRPERPLIDTPTQMTRYNGVLMKTVPYICIIPSNVIYLGQQVPITIKISPAESAVQVLTGVIKLKQYTTLNVRGGEKSSKKELLNVALKNGWPQAEAGNSWQRTIVVPVPGFPQVTPSISSPMITKSHILKLILDARIGMNGHRSELRVEMPVTITGPRPVGEPYPSFDLHRYLDYVDKI
ncbi:hypothetical protein BGX21_011069 [Mortierella sp. AD011]|nr:hypothetical protein BGX20_011084 [Mortierella sp. AD010]KAF9392174.1 hypothetical protein BGX21_011069 [Mortierella sp. AD011]